MAERQRSTGTDMAAATPSGPRQARLKGTPVLVLHTESGVALVLRAQEWEAVLAGNLGFTGVVACREEDVEYAP